MQMQKLYRVTLIQPPSYYFLCGGNADEIRVKLAQEDQRRNDRNNTSTGFVMSLLTEKNKTEYELTYADNFRAKIYVYNEEDFNIGK